MAENLIPNMAFYHPPKEDRITELENRVVELERKLELIVTQKKPSFMDFQFIKEEEETTKDSFLADLDDMESIHRQQNLWAKQEIDRLERELPAWSKKKPKFR